MNPTDEARLDWSEDGPDEADVLADNEVLAAENARLNTENDSLRKLVEAMREEVAQSILLSSDYARERDQARDQRDDARTRADAFAKELTEIAEVLPSRPMMLGPDGPVTLTGPNRLAGQVRAIVAERDELRAAGDALMATTRSLAYAWETESPDRVMWDKWKEVQPAVQAWMDATALGVTHE